MKWAFICKKNKRSISYGTICAPVQGAISYLNGIFERLSDDSKIYHLFMRLFIERVFFLRVFNPAA